MKLDNTITSIFIVPTLEIGRDRLLANGFINGFIKDEHRDVQYENAVYLLFRSKNVDKFKTFLDEEYARTNFIIDDYDYKGGYIVIVYKLDSRWNEDFKLVKKGQYSKTSKDFQKVFKKTVKVIRNLVSVEEMSLQHMIFSKAEKLRSFWEKELNVTFSEDMEVWQGWIEENEILNLSKLQK